MRTNQTVAIVIPAKEKTHAARRTFLGLGMVGLAISLLQACGGGGGGGGGGSVAADFSGLVDIGGDRKMYLECRGNGSPTIVLINGLGGAADYWNSTETAAPAAAGEVSRFARVCAYDRPGTVRVDNQFSRSDPIPQPSSEQSAVADLHAMLAAAGVRGPYVLAAHSYGGFIARLYASTFPHSGHNIPRENPAIVTEAIRGVFEAVRRQARRERT